MKILSNIVSRFVGRALWIAHTPGFICKPGIYQLAANGSQLEVTEAFRGRHSLSRTRIDGPIREKVAVRDYFRHEGWFVYVESPSRLWLFDGIYQLDLLTPTERFSVSTKDVYDSCPQVVWAAVPDSTKKYLHRKLASPHTNN